MKLGPLRGRAVEQTVESAQVTLNSSTNKTPTASPTASPVVKRVKHGTISADELHVEDILNLEDSNLVYSPVKEIGEV